jgi:hypothetical protein
MLTAYINAAMRKAHYEIFPDNEGYFGHASAYSLACERIIP